VDGSIAQRCPEVEHGSGCRVIGAAEVSALARLAVLHLEELCLRRAVRRRVVALYPAIADQVRGLTRREPAILMRKIRIAIPALRLHPYLPAHSCPLTQTLAG
jgi:hypothetical protein